MVVPSDVVAVIGQTIFKVSTGETDQYRAAAVAAPIIANLQRRISTAREAGKRLEQITVEQLAERYQAERKEHPEQAQITRITDVIKFVLNTYRHDWRDYSRQVVESGYDAHTALRLLPDGGAAANAADRITGYATPFLTYVERWKPNSGLEPRPLDQAISSIKQFDKAAGKPIEQIQGKDVQAWIENLINAEGETGLDADTVRRKLAEIRNYWRWLQKHQIISEDHKPFSDRLVRDPPHRRKTKEERRQRFRPADVVRLWREAERQGDNELVKTIKIAAYSGARIEGVAQLKTSDIRLDYDTGVRYMRMVDKTAAGDRFVPIHPKLSKLIDEAIKGADGQGYLIHSDARNKYNERSQPIGKRFGRLKTRAGFDGRYVFHSLRKTVAALFQDARCDEAVAADIVGHTKPTMTYGLYAGETRMDLRSKWLAKAVRYPPITDARLLRLDERVAPPRAPSPVELPPSIFVRDARDSGRSRKSQKSPRVARAVARQRRTT
jgi:site-specific recombinase XerD